MNMRTQGRNAIEADPTTETLMTISANYGHEDLAQTIDYLGLPVDNIGQMQVKRSAFMQQVRERKMKGEAPLKDYAVRISR